MGTSKRTKEPRYRMVIAALRRELGDGTLPAGVKLPPLRELAERFEVSTNTIRNALRTLESEGSLYHVPAVGAFVSPTYPSHSAVSQVGLALVTLDIGGALEMGIARGIEGACQDRGWGLHIYDSRNDPDLEHRNLERLAKTGANGAIILPTGLAHNIEGLFKLKLSRFPFVLVDRSIAGLNVDTIESDHGKSAYLATEYLIQRGHEQVFMLTEPAGASSIEARMRGYEQALIDHGIDPRRDWKVWVDPEVSARGVREEHRWLGGYEASLPVLERHAGPLAFFALNDYIAWGLFEACRKLGRRIPDQVSIVCIDDSDITRAMTPPLTTVAQRPKEIGRRAVEILEQRLKAVNDPIEPQHVLIDVDLIERHSVADRR